LRPFSSHSPTFQRLGVALLSALERNTEALATNKAIAEQTLKATEATAKAAQYLAAIERHRQETAGQRTNFDGWLQ
jgi:hypothetical protein